MAGNAVETPRLLLMSTSSRYPNGIGNSSGLVGKYFTEHIDVGLWTRFAERLEAWRGVPTGGMAQDFYETKPRNGFARGWMFLLNNSKQWPLSVAKNYSPGWGVDHKARMKQMFGHVVALAGIGEQLPDVRNQVTLDPGVKDIFGLPVPRLALQPYDNDRAMIRMMFNQLTEISQAAGAVEVVKANHVTGRSAHFMGTCRMGVDPRKSVVNPWCRTHNCSPNKQPLDVPNLFIGDGSVFVTGAAVNPALTISALATRTAEGILSAFKRGEL